jgi:hypothetical protein
MGDRIDRFRSLIRTAATSAADKVAQATPIGKVRDAIRELRERRARIPERQLARAVLRAGTVAAASVRTRNGRIEVTAELESGRAVHCALRPGRVQFAPRGAKEIFFSVEPPEAADDPKVREIAGLFAAQVARALWAPFLGPPTAAIDDGALVDRDGALLRIDLRTCPSMRAAQSIGPAGAMMMDMLAIERFAVDDEGLSIWLALPKISP